MSPAFLLRRAQPISWANGLLIGANDLWIAAAGLAYRMPVMSRNARHFERVPGLEVVGYP